jgi:hypothetical protein
MSQPTSDPGAGEEVLVQKIEYYRQVRPPTLKQYLYRRAVREAMKEVAGQDGVTTNPETGTVIPKSALAARDALKGLTTEVILEKHPEWKEDYERDISTGR